MNLLFLIVIGLAFTAFAALIFSVLTLLIGLVWDEFEVHGPEGWRFSEFYLRYLIVAAVFTFVSIPVGNPLLGLVALMLAYKYVFDAGWVQAIVIGFLGGLIASVLFSVLVRLILAPFDLI